jgi:hypothetical protein
MIPAVPPAAADGSRKTAQIKCMISLPFRCPGLYYFLTSWEAAFPKGTAASSDFGGMIQAPDAGKFCTRA